MTVDRTGPGPSRPDADERFLRYWLLWVSLGETVGLLAPAVAQLGLTGSPLGPAPLLVAGAVEGTVLGWTQATVLRVPVPTLSRSRWVAATATGAAAAWFLGLLPAEWADVWQRWPAPTQLVVGALLAVLLVSTIGFAQWFELRRRLAGALWWIPGSAVAWCAGLAVFFAVATPLWEPGQPWPLALLVGLVAALLMALTTALVSGLVLLRLLRRAPTRTRGRH